MPWVVVSDYGYLMCLQSNSLQEHLLSQREDEASVMQSGTVMKEARSEQKYLMQRAYLLCGIVGMNLLINKVNHWHQHKQVCIFVINHSLEKIDPLMVTSSNTQQPSDGFSRKGPLRHLTSFMAKVVQSKRGPRKHSPSSKRQFLGGPIREDHLGHFAEDLLKISKCIKSGNGIH